jgi:hypothetical protein
VAAITQNTKHDEQRREIAKLQPFDIVPFDGRHMNLTRIEQAEAKPIG